MPTRAVNVKQQVADLERGRATELACLLDYMNSSGYAGYR